MQNTNLMTAEAFTEAGNKLLNAKIKEGYRHVATYVYTDSIGQVTFARTRLEKLTDGKVEKLIRPISTINGGFELKAPDFNGKNPLYKLHTLKDAPFIFIVEGEKCADALIALGICATTSGGATSHDKADWEPLRAKQVYILPDNDPAGFKHANEIKAILLPKECIVKVLDIKALGLPEKGDIADWLELNSQATKADIEALPWILAAAEDHNISESEDQVIERLAKLSVPEYDKVRKAESKNLGIRIGTLDALVKEMQTHEVAQQCDFFTEDDPWPDPVDGAALLSDLATLIHRYIVCQPEVAQAATLWIVMTYLMDCISIAPLAIITAPDKACGKSKLLEVKGKLCYRPMPTSNISASALFRSIEAWQPTLLIDETDTFLRDNEDLRGIINSGHTRSNAYVMRVEGENHEPKRYKTWAPKALSGIGNKNLHDTITSRAIILDLRRKLPSETIDRLRANDDVAFKPLRQKILRFAEDHRFFIEHARPELPEALSDREQDNWEALLAIADAAGGVWPDLARKTAITLSKKAETKSFKAELLEDIRVVFEHSGSDRISSADLISALCRDDEAAWKTYNHGREISPKQLAGLLKGYGIVSNTIRTRLGTPKGYHLNQFVEVWERYTNTSSTEQNPYFPATTTQPNRYMGESVAGSNWSATSETAPAT